MLLTKLQIVQLNNKDLRDIWAILHEHDVAEHDDDAVNAARVAEVLASDWGLWRQRVRRSRPPATGSTGPSSPKTSCLLNDRLARLWERVEAQPKGLRWRGRAKVGDRTKWYEEPEEIAHATRGDNEDRDPEPGDVQSFLHDAIHEGASGDAVLRCASGSARSSDASFETEHAPQFRANCSHRLRFPAHAVEALAPRGAGVARPCLRREIADDLLGRVREVAWLKVAERQAG